MPRFPVVTAVLPALIALAATLLLVADGAIADEPANLSAADLDFFETKIRPVLVERCYECHADDAEMLQGSLRVDSRAGLLAGGDSGPAIVPGQPEESLLLEALRYETFEMPPDGKLKDSVIRDFEEWIARGAPDPRSGAAPIARDGIDIEEGRKHWCFQPIEPHEPPTVSDEAWPYGRIDRFLLAKLAEQSLEPAVDAQRAAWLRRVTYDLIGLPPTIAQIDDFLNDNAPDAYERVVDRLLASPHYGERWGRHWLDVARFAESSGGGRSLIFPDAWRYRDYVIEAFNADKPLDEFIIEQIAGDLLPHADDGEQREHLIATAYLLLGAHNYEEQDKRALEMDVVDEQLDTIGRGLLGMTIACARCHDHKFDPIPTSDYYALAGILRSTNVLKHSNVSKWTTRELPATSSEQARIDTHNEAVKELTAKVHAAKKLKDVPERDKQVAALRKELAALKKRAPIPRAMAVDEAEAIENCAICIRGSVKHRGEVIPRGMLQVAMLDEPPQMPADQSGRLELAQWIASSRNPLTARVYVNRVWHYLFGAGLVRTLDNFGTTGETPSHPELLDDLAIRFMDGGWSTKRLVREIVLSHAYRMSTQSGDQAATVDPENRLLSHMNRRRLDAESLRDAMLMTAGTLDLAIGGRNISEETLTKSSPITPAEYGFVFTSTRRSVYTPAFRNWMHDLFEVFDFADQNRAVGARSLTTTAPQALLLLNSEFVMEQAEHAARRALSDGGLTDDQRIERAFRETLGRKPTNAEREIARKAVANIEDDEDRLSAWQQLFQGLFACVDFRYLD